MKVNSAGSLPKCVIELKTATLYILLVEIVPIKLARKRL